MERNIVLIGMPGSGKTQVGKRLAAALSRPYFDADEALVALAGESIAALFAQGEEVFRDWETKTCAALAKKTGAVIATGGGVVKREENIRLLRENGVLVFLDRAPEDIVADVDCAGRPLLKNGPGEVYRLYEERIALYRAACDLTVKNDSSLEEAVGRAASAVAAWEDERKEMTEE